MLRVALAARAKTAREHPECHLSRAQTSRKNIVPFRNFRFGVLSQVSLGGLNSGRQGLPA
jgi:hypothetical protein